MLNKMNGYGSAFAGAAFHCYAGSVRDQDAFHNAFPSKVSRTFSDWNVTNISLKDVYFTECAGTIGSDWWSDIKV
jgi:hypothetical protein